MTYYDIFIGDLEDPLFNWGKNLKDESVDEDIPAKITENFPDTNMNKFINVINMYEKKGFKGAQTGWGTHVVEVTKKQISEFIIENYPNVTKGIKKEFKELIKIINNLDDNKTYYLVAQEF